MFIRKLIEVLVFSAAVAITGLGATMPAEQNSLPATAQASTSVPNSKKRQHHHRRRSKKSSKHVPNAASLSKESW